MGFAVVHPRQLAPSVGKKQVGSTVSAVPSPAIDNPATQMESALFGSLGFVAHLPILQSIFADLHADADLTFGGFRIYVNRWGTLRLTDRARSPPARPRSTPPTTSAPTPLDAGSPSFEAPACAATDIVHCASRRQVVIINCRATSPRRLRPACRVLSATRRATPPRNLAGSTLGG